MPRRKAPTVESEEDPDAWGGTLEDADQFESLRRSGRARKPVVDPPEEQQHVINTKPSTAKAASNKRDVDESESNEANPPKRKRGRPPKNRQRPEQEQHSAKSSQKQSHKESEAEESDEEFIMDEHMTNRSSSTSSSSKSLKADVEHPSSSVVASEPVKKGGIAKRAISNLVSAVATTNLSSLSTSSEDPTKPTTLSTSAPFMTPLRTR